MRVVILQPSYIPWRGYFHQIQKADRFVSESNRHCRFRQAERTGLGAGLRASMSNNLGV